MAAHKYTVTFTDGTTATRGSDRVYTHAALRRTPWSPERPWVTFHGSREAALKGTHWVEYAAVVDLKAKPE